MEWQIGRDYKIKFVLNKQGETEIKRYRLIDITEHGLFVFKPKTGKNVCLDTWEFKQKMAKGEIRAV